MLQGRLFFASLSVAVLVGVSGCGEDSKETTSAGGAGGSGGSGAGTTAASGGGGAGGGAGAAGGGGSGGAATTTATEVMIGGDRPVKMYIPDGYDPSKAAPLVVLLHGYGASGSIQEIYFGLKSVANERGFVYAVPDGTTDGMGNQFWNATDACCGFGASVDDSAYLSGVVEQIKAAYTIDPKRVYFVGHSNGGFMSYRMACDHAGDIAAIVSLAGATFADDSACKPSSPVAVAQVHGTLDETIAYDGGLIGGVLEYPSAQTTVETWAAHDGCALTSTSGGTLDLESQLAGEETTVSVYANGCEAGGHVELWTIEGGKHIPSLSADFKKKVFDFLEAHPKP